MADEVRRQLVVSLGNANPHQHGGSFTFVVAQVWRVLAARLSGQHVMINGHDFCPPLSLLATLRSAATAVHEEAVSRRILTADCRHGR